jgi:PhnB protein
MKLNPYINFAGNAEEALDFYKSVLGGEITSIKRYSETPMPCDDDKKQKIMHAVFVFDGNELLISDRPKGSPVSTNGNIQFSVEVENEAKADEVFNKMAEGGKIVMPLAAQFWGAKFGMVQDKFGINWMFSCEVKK